ncbi:O-antigen ligase family protein [Paenisporosarcina cavernae]|uniref:O-antigen ligase domain-containing protein n=1 Tax=Paenisporosarcina cavernae TaxID=2320858 RepID=A0A385YQA8_9BACL|nr:O-antigen ligase family protein [Paenisporosarcina cavernae]AYC28915.1 hypothetical protein D3873_03160 [Paenisporosarcina cavernae]
MIQTLLQKKYLLYILAFIIVQPVIDVLTTFSIYVLEIDVTFGVIIRVAFMVLMGVLLLLFAMKSKQAKLFVVYLIGLAIMIVINIYLNTSTKDPYYLFDELKFFNKVVYFHVVFLGFLLVYEELTRLKVDVEKKTTSYLFYSGVIIGLVFILAQITGTSLANYASYKKGFSGWFFAGNEIGAIMAMVLPIVALYAIERTANAKKPWFWIPFVMLSMGMLALGTKVGYGGILVVLLSVAIGSLIIWFWKKEATKKVKSNFVVSVSLIVLLAVATPFTPVFSNMYAHLDLLNIDFGGEDAPGEVEPEDEEPVITEEEFQNLVFSSREKYVKEFAQDFNQAPTTQKIFGMGFAGNYDEKELGKDLKMIEMDFYDLFYSFGWLGFIYLMTPFFYYAVRIIVKFVKNLKEYFTYEYMLYGVALLLGLGIAYTAGHVFTAPAVSIYLAMLLAFMNRWTPTIKL